MQGPKDHMTDLLFCVCDDMGIIRSGIVICFQVDPVDEWGRGSLQDGIHTGEVIWYDLETSLVKAEADNVPEELFFTWNNLELISRFIEWIQRVSGKHRGLVRIMIQLS